MESKSLIEYSAGLPDPRKENRRHNLVDIIVNLVFASVCGAEKRRDIEVLDKRTEQWLQRFLELPHGIPSHDTFARVVAMLDPEQLNDRFSSCVASVNPQPGGGPDLRGAGVSLWAAAASANGITAVDHDVRPGDVP